MEAAVRATIATLGTLGATITERVCEGGRSWVGVEWRFLKQLFEQS